MKTGQSNRTFKSVKTKFRYVISIMGRNGSKKISDTKLDRNPKTSILKVSKSRKS